MDTQAELIQKAVKAYEEAQEAQKNGNWSGYGDYLKQLESYLEKLAKSE